MVVFQIYQLEAKYMLLKIDDIIKKYVGIPFVKNGRYYKTGLDCVGLLLCIAKELDYYLPDVIDSNFDFCKYGDEIDVINGILEPLDVLIFKDENNDLHIGIYLGGNRFLHAVENSYIKISLLLGTHKRRLIGAWRWRLELNFQ